MHQSRLEPTRDEAMRAAPCYFPPTQAYLKLHNSKSCADLNVRVEELPHCHHTTHFTLKLSYSVLHTVTALSS